jgi:hypothetical protein
MYLFKKSAQQTANTVDNKRKVGNQVRVSIFLALCLKFVFIF